MDGETDTLLSQRQIDTEPVSMVVDPGTDRIYIAGYTPVVNGATLTVYDGADTPTDSTPPVITVPASFSVEATSAAGAIASYTASAVDDVDGIVAVTCTPESGLLFHMLSTAVGCTAVDQAGNIGANSFSITVDDTTPPTIASITPSQSTLWPPNHALVPLTIAVAATDVVDPSPSCHIDGVASNQPVTPGEADWVIDGALALRLRSERDDGIERVYSIAIACSDIRGNVSHSTTAVAVRHNP